MEQTNWQNKLFKVKTKVLICNSKTKKNIHCKVPYENVITLYIITKITDRKNIQRQTIFVVMKA